MSLQTVPLADICEKITDGTHHSPPIVSEGVPYVTAKHIKESGVSFFDDPWFVSQESHDEIYSRCDPRLGDVLYIKDGVTTGIAAVNDYEFPFSMLSSVALLRPKPDVCDPKFLAFWLNSPSARERYLSRMGGAAIKRLTLAKIKRFQIPLPPLAQQKRIAGILDVANVLRAKRRESLDQLDALLESTFLDMFGDPVANPMGWEVKELADVVKAGTIVTYGIVQAGKEFPGGVPYIRTGDIVDGEIRVEGLRRTDPAIAAKFERSRVLGGEIVMSIRATVGPTAEVPLELEGANLTQGTARISPGKETILSFLLSFMRSHGCQEWIQRQIKGATFREITLKRLRQMPICVPPLNLQQHFATIVDSVEQQKTRMRAHLAELDTLFASLQQRAFNGEL